MKNLTNDKNLIIRKLVNSNSVVAIDRGTRNKRIDLILSHQIKFLKVDVPKNSLLQLSINKEK